MNKKRNDWADVMAAKEEPYVAFEERMKRLFVGLDKLNELADVDKEIMRAMLREQKLAAMRA